jgi:hypothetical protein
MMRSTILLAISLAVLVSGTLTAGRDDGPLRGKQNAAAMLGGIIAFENTESLRMDNASGFVEHLALLNYTGQPMRALELRVANTMGKIRITRATLDPAFTGGGWIAQTRIIRSALQPDRGTNDTVVAVLLGLDTNYIQPAMQRRVLSIEYETVDVLSSDPSTTTLQILEATGSLDDGADAMITAGSPLRIRLTNSIYKGDLDADDDVNVTDLLTIISSLLGKVTLSADGHQRADIAPWPNGDGSVDVRDLALTQWTILNAQYPNGTPLLVSGSGPEDLASAPAPAPDARITVYINKAGIDVRMENAVNVKGFQLELNNVATVADTMTVGSVWGPGNWTLNSNVLRTLVYSSTSTTLPPGNRHIAWMRFPIDNPFGISLKKVIIADAQNEAIQNMEVAVVYGTVGVEEMVGPATATLQQNYPNPFTPSTTVEYDLENAGNADVQVYDLFGRRVAMLVQGWQTAGKHALTWDGRDDSGRLLPTGTYHLLLSHDGAVRQRMMHIVR